MAAWARSGLGETEEAIALLTYLIDELGRHGMRAWSGHAKFILADACLRAGDAARAAQVASEALEIALATEDRACAGWAMRCQGQAALALGQLREARECLERALQLFEALEAPIDCAYCLVERALVARAEGKAQAAGRDLRRARELFTQCGVLAPLERIERSSAPARARPSSARSAT